MPTEISPAIAEFLGRIADRIEALPVSEIIDKKSDEIYRELHRFLTADDAYRARQTVLQIITDPLRDSETAKHQIAAMLREMITPAAGDGNNDFNWRPASSREFRGWIGQLDEFGYLVEKWKGRFISKWFKADNQIGKRLINRDEIDKLIRMAVENGINIAIFPYKVDEPNLFGYLAVFGIFDSKTAADWSYIWGDAADEDEYFEITPEMEAFVERKRKDGSIIITEPGQHPSIIGLFMEDPEMFGEGVENTHLLEKADVVRVIKEVIDAGFGVKTTPYESYSAEHRARIQTYNVEILPPGPTIEEREKDYYGDGGGSVRSTCTSNPHTHKNGDYFFKTDEEAQNYLDKNYGNTTLLRGDVSTLGREYDPDRFYVISHQTNKGVGELREIKDENGKKIGWSFKPLQSPQSGYSNECEPNGTARGDGNEPDYMKTIREAMGEGVRDHNSKKTQGPLSEDQKRVIAWMDDTRRGAILVDGKWLFLEDIRQDDEMAKKAIIAYNIPKK